MWSPGDHLTVRGAAWQVLRTTPFPDCDALDVSGVPYGEPRTFLLPFDRPARVPPPRLRVVSRGQWARGCEALLSRSFPAGGLRFCPRTIQLLPYQLEPALAVLRHGALRVLIADDVGLGKTVEAGLLVREVAKTGHLSRTLIVCPAGLRQQWLEELRALFDIEAVDADAAWLQRAARGLPRDVNPWSLPGVYLVSADFLKRPEALRPVEDVRWDLLVVDEAHTATPRSDRRAAVHAVACRSRRVLLLTATPHSGDEAAFTQLCALGAANATAPLVLFSRSRTDVPVPAAPPRTTLLPVALTEAERLALRLLEDYTGHLWELSVRRLERTAALVATVLRKRALSSPSTLGLSIRRRMALLGTAPCLPAQLTLPLHEDGSDEAGGASDQVLAAPGLDDPEEERTMLGRIADAAEAAARGESKLRVLLRLALRVREPIIVFSEYRDTAVRIVQHLSGSGRTVLLLHGGLAQDERREIVRVFGKGGSMLIATDAASEGLNLHQACRTVVHFELPWTPVRLHQRAGRVNRIGQARRVHEIALVANDSSERLVLAPLLQRGARSGPLNRSAVMHHVSESRIAAAMFGGTARLPEVRWAPPPHVSMLNLGEEAREEAERLGLLRRLPVRPTPRDACPGRHGCMDVLIARRRLRARTVLGALTVLVGISISDAAGELTERDLVAVSFDLGPFTWERSSGALRAQVQAALSRVGGALCATLQDRISTRLLRVTPSRTALLAALDRRESEITGQLRSTARDLVQAGLFDRRALRARGARKRVLQAASEEVRAGRTAVAPGPAGRFEVAAVLVSGWS